MITETAIQELIRCPKQARKVERRRMLAENRSLRNAVTLISRNEKYTFKLFLRQSLEFSEDFSVGLIWTNAVKHIGIGKDIILIRYQGPHDSGKPFGEDLHNEYHVHEISPEDIKNRRYLRPGNKSVSRDFSSFSGALFSFVDYCSILGLETLIDYSQFPPLNQLSLFD